MRPSSVLLACEWYLRYTVGLARGLVDQGVDVSLITRSHGGEFGGRPQGMRDFVVAELGRRAAHPHRRTRARPARRTRDGPGPPGRPPVRAGRDPRPGQPAERPPAARRGRRPPWALRAHGARHRRAPGRPPDNGRQRALWRALVRGAGLVFVHAEPLREQLIAEHAPRRRGGGRAHGSELVGDRAAARSRPRSCSSGASPRTRGWTRCLTRCRCLARSPETRLTVAGKGRSRRIPCWATARVTLRNEYVPDEDVPGLFGAATCVVLPYREASQSGVARSPAATAAASWPPRSAACPTTWRARVERSVVPPEDPRRSRRPSVRSSARRGSPERMGREAAEAARTSLAWPRVARLTLDAYERHLMPPGARSGAGPRPRRSAGSPPSAARSLGAQPEECGGDGAGTPGAAAWGTSTDLSP